MIFHFLQFPKYTTQPQRKQVARGRQAETDDLSDGKGECRLAQIGADWAQIGVQIGVGPRRLGSDQAKALDILRIGSKPDLIMVLNAGV